MFLIEKFSHHLASKISNALALDKDREEVLAYGAFTIVQTVWTILLIVLFGMLFRVLWKALFMAFIGALLRKHSGGAHATSPNRCAFISAVTFSGLAWIVNGMIVYSTIVIILLCGLLSFLAAYYIVCKYSPVDNPNKPIKKEKTKQRLRKSSIRTLHVLLIITLLLALFYFKSRNKNVLKTIVCIYTGVLWQSFVLTSPGHFVIHSLDGLFKNITAFIGGGEKKMKKKLFMSMAVLGASVLTFFAFMASASACFFGYYQPEEPACLKQE